MAEWHKAIKVRSLNQKDVATRRLAQDRFRALRQRDQFL